MPNHVTNKLTVCGDVESIAKFKAACVYKKRREAPQWWLDEIAKNGPRAEGCKQWLADLEKAPEYDVFDFERIIPVPAFICRDNLTYGCRHETTKRNWYAWQRSQWGTKWNAYDVSIECEEPEKLTIVFDTAWNVPFPVLETLAFWFSELHFNLRFFDEGHNFWGFATTLDGKWTVNEYPDQSPESEKLKRELCIELKGYDPDKEDDDDEIEDEMNA